MTDEIINGINVAKCEFFNNYECNIYVNEYWESQDNTKDMCKWHENCYYKQLKRLEFKLKVTKADHEASEQENARLKEELEPYKHPDVITLLTNWRTGELDRTHNKIANERDKYRQTLQEIKAIAENAYCLTNYTNKDMADFAKQILATITKAEEE